MDDPSSFGSGMERYSTGKLLNILWLRELSSRVRNGGNILINRVNPGICASELHRSDTTPGVVLFNKIFASSLRLGGIVWLMRRLCKGIWAAMSVSRFPRGNSLL
jgi:NAD(P)-dependent dehydrogenase (short-subunit alcohol dehydrogenase family)